MTNTNLDTIAVGWPIERLGVAFYPLYLPNNTLPAITTGEDSGLVIDELESADVNTLRVTNPTDKPILIVEGEHFLGGKQNRAINTSVLVASLSNLDIPVSCLEEGRWGSRQEWRRSQSFAPDRIRAVQRASVTRHMRETGHHASDQEDVWQEVHSMLEEADVESNSSAASDLDQSYRRYRPNVDVIEELIHRGPLPNQCGVAVFHGREMSTVDLFGASHLLQAHWGRLVRSHFYMPTEPKKRPSVDRVLAHIRQFGQRHTNWTQGVGLGVERRILEKDMNGYMLSLNDNVVHAAF